MKYLNPLNTKNIKKHKKTDYDIFLSQPPIDRVEKNEKNK